MKRGFRNALLFMTLSGMGLGAKAQTTPHKKNPSFNTPGATTTTAKPVAKAPVKDTTVTFTAPADSAKTATASDTAHVTRDAKTKAAIKTDGVDNAHLTDSAMTTLSGYKVADVAHNPADNTFNVFFSPSGKMGKGEYVSAVREVQQTIHRKKIKETSERLELNINTGTRQATILIDKNPSRSKKEKKTGAYSEQHKSIKFYYQDFKTGEKWLVENEDKYDSKQWFNSEKLQDHEMETAKEIAELAATNPDAALDKIRVDNAYIAYRVASIKLDRLQREQNRVEDLAYQKRQMEKENAFGLDEDLLTTHKNWHYLENSLRFNNDGTYSMSYVHNYQDQYKPEYEVVNTVTRVLVNNKSGSSKDMMVENLFSAKKGDQEFLVDAFYQKNRVDVLKVQELRNTKAGNKVVYDRTIVDHNTLTGLYNEFFIPDPYSHEWKRPEVDNTRNTLLELGLLKP